MIFSQKKIRRIFASISWFPTTKKNVSSVKRVDMRPRGVISSYSRA